MMIKKTDVTAIILAGGKSERMNGKDKGLLRINNQYVIKHLYNLSKNYSSNVYINANRNIDDYTKMGFEVWQDIIPGYQGPLAGMYTSLKNSKTQYILTLPCDGPLVNAIYFERMLRVSDENKVELRSAHNGERLQPVYSLISIDLITSLKSFLDSGQRKIDKWFGLCKLEEIDFSDNKNLFININKESDLVEYRELINRYLKDYE